MIKRLALPIFLFLSPLYALLCAPLYVQQGNFPSSSGGGIATNGTGGTTNPAAPVMGFYLSNSCPVANTGQCFFTQADAVEINDASWTNASTTLAANSAHFTVNDVGKSGMGWTTCATDQASSFTNSGQISNTALVTINTFTDTQHVVLSATPAATATFSGSYPQGGCFIYGHLDDSGAAAMDTAMQAATSCPQGIFTAAYYFFQNPHFFTNPASCAGIGPGISSGAGTNYGNTILPAGMHLEGRGPGASTWFIAPSFPNGDACHNKGGAGGAAVGGCFAIPVMGQWSGLRFDGGSQALAANLSGLSFAFASVAGLREVTFTNLGAYNTGQMVCLELNHDVQLFQVNISGCGQIGMLIGTNTGNNICHSCAVENDDQSLKVIGPNAFSNIAPQFQCYYCNFLHLNPTTLPTSNINSRAGNILLVGGEVRVFNGSTTNQLTGYNCTTTPGCILNTIGTIFQYSIGGGTNNNTAINCVVACTNFFQTTTLTSQSAGTDITDSAGSVEHDLGGNTFTPRMSLSGQFVNEINSANNTGITAAKLVLSGTWGASAANTALSGGDFPIQFTITNTGAGQGASPTITYTFPTALPVAPFTCTATQIGGTNASLNPFTTSSLTSTGAVFTATGTPTAAATEIMNVTCVTP